MATESEKKRHIRSFVRRGGRMSRLQQRAYTEYRERHCVSYRPASLSFPELFGRTAEVIVEIGFGSGSATVKIAEENPQKDYLGIEVFQAGIGAVLHQIETRELDNLKIVEHDAVEVFRNMIEGNSLAGIHIFFPDPWPKKKHHKRRIIQPSFARILLNALRPGGYIYFVTDWEDYANHARKVFSGIDGLEKEEGALTSAAVRRPETRFERKGLEKQHRIFELRYVKT